MFVDALTKQFSLRQTWLFLWAFVGISVANLSAINPSNAAVQGPPGPTSSGSTEITYVQGLNARISGLADMPLGAWSGSGSLTANNDICIGRSGVGFFGSGAYRVRAQGDGEPGNPAAFTLSNGTNLLYYNVFFNDQTGTANRTPLTAGTTLTGQTGSGFAFVFNLIFGCAATNANLSIEVPESQLQQHIGIFTGTLSLTLIPE